MHQINDKTKDKPDNIPYIIHVDDLTKVFWTNKLRQKALSGVALDISSGEYVAIVGMDGGGKTTLLKILAGLARPNTGKVVISGRDLSRMSVDQLSSFRLKNIGFIPQSPSLMDTLTIQENIAFPLMVQKVRKSERLERARLILKTFDLGKHLGHMPYQLSGVERRYITIARALITRPKIVLVDEPTANLIGHDAEIILKELRQLLVENDITLVATTHDRQKAILADRIIGIKDGRIL